jgi:hypothetical protein
MKINAWTKVLVGAGVLSLPAILVAEEKSSSLMTAVSSTTLSGYVDTSMQWNPGTGNARLPDYRFNSSSKADGFNLDVVQLRIEKPLDEAEWAAGYRVDLWAGPDANVLGTQSVYGNSSFASAGDFAIRQAYVALRTPIGNGLDFKVGVFDSILGYESVEAPANPNYTRSFGHTIEPQTHTGILGTYRFCQCFTASFGVADTIGPTINERAHGPNSSGETKAESFKTYMGSIAVTAPDNWGCLSGSTLYGGIVNGFTSSYGENQTSYYVGAAVGTPVKGLRVGAAFDALDVHDESGETWAASAYASWQVSEKFSMHGRAEYLRDRGVQKFFVDDLGPTNPDKVLSLTLDLQYDLWKNVLSRLEVRWDHSLTAVGVWGDPSGAVASSAAVPYGVTQTSSGLDNAVLVALNIIYKF